MNCSVAGKNTLMKICCEETLWNADQEVKNFNSYWRRAGKKGYAQPWKRCKWRRELLGINGVLPLVAGSWRGFGVVELDSQKYSRELWRRNGRVLMHSGRVLHTISLVSLNFAECGRSECIGLLYMKLWRKNSTPCSYWKKNTSGCRIRRFIVMMLQSLIPYVEIFMASPWKIIDLIMNYNRIPSESLNFWAESPAADNFTCFLEPVKQGHDWLMLSSTWPVLPAPERQGESWGKVDLREGPAFHLSVDFFKAWMAKCWTTAAHWGSS